ncbi:MAG: helicase-exonuclease AddAB subunit AddA [Bacillota bacterium]
MPSTAWTAEQKEAVTRRGKNLLVAASAGTGKTAVLVGRVFRAVLEEPGLDLDRLLVVTFTEAAAGELRQRLGAALAEALQNDPANPHLQRQLFLLPRAHIGTLHSFCADVVRRHFYLLGLDPGFRIMEAHEAAMLRQEVLEGVVAALYEEHEESPPETPFLYLARALSGRHGDDRNLLALVLRLYDCAHTLPRPRAWLRRMVQVLAEARGKPWEKQPWAGVWRELVRLRLAHCRERLAAAQDLARRPGGPARYLPVLEADLRRVEGWLDLVNGPYAPLQEALGGGDGWARLPQVRRDEAEAGLKERVKKLRDEVKKLVQELAGTWLARPEDAVLGDLARAAPLVEALVETTLRFADAYRQAKRERSVADFADLEHYALAVLATDAELSPWGEESRTQQPECGVDPDAGFRPSPVAFEYRARLGEVLVDEYQDINGLQEAILRLVAPPGSRFMVGDVKQSIYRFRHADPQVFLACYRRYRDLDARGAGDPPGWRIDLAKNFRSREAVLETVNFLFRRLMTGPVGEMEYDARASLRAGRTYPAPGSGRAGGPVEFHLLEFAPPGVGEVAAARPGGEAAEPGEGRDAAPEDIDAVRLEARWVAARIRRLVRDEGCVVFDPSTGGYRPVAWRDVAVLLRSPRGRVGIYLEELRRLDVPAYADGSGGYFAAPEVQTVLSLLQLIDNPRCDIPLAAVLRSPLVGLDAAQLAAIRLAVPEGSFFGAVARAAKGEAGVPPEVAARLGEFWRRLEAWRDLARWLPPADLIEELYRQTGYYDLVGAMPAGTVRQANLRALVDRARRFAGTIYRGLFHFLRYIERVQAEGGDMDTARSLGENEDVVRLLSIHRSKGLEFPVVFLAGLGHRFNLQDLAGDFLFHRRLGCGPKVFDLERGVVFPTVLHRLVRERLRWEMLAEEMRLLYVALTRARERLFVTAAVRDLDGAVAKWRDEVAGLAPDAPLPAAFLARAATPLDWVGPALCSHPAFSDLPAGPDRILATGFWHLHLWPAAELEGLWARDAGGTGAHPSEPAPVAGDLPPDFSKSETGTGPLRAALRNLAPVPGDWLAREEAAWARQEGGVLPAEELGARLFWTNPYRALAELPSKVTVTEWRHRLEVLEAETEEVPVRAVSGGEAAAGNAGGVAGGSELPPGFVLPAWFAAGRPDGTVRGRAVHLVMKLLDLDAAPDEETIGRQIEAMVAGDLLTAAEAELVPVREIARFLRTDLGRRVVTAAREGRLWREVPFTIGLPVTELEPGLTGAAYAGETVLVQGVIDCLLAAGDGLVIVDYKSDRVAAGELNACAARYRVQLELYARAAAEILGRPVREKYLYFFAPGRAVAVR